MLKAWNTPEKFSWLETIDIAILWVKYWENEWEKKEFLEKIGEKSYNRFNLQTLLKAKFHTTLSQIIPHFQLIQNSVVLIWE